ncbi:hypothetical protein KFZ76_10805 [Methylovulum psychrotolerans]|uniref:hypothetical protein n=1 Tax=Methylovulum psychrotolerans TaxID=1704499 RepID=UPI001BFF4DA3|nr:hypothetical protein [Methylovulum psychrotolerans]MBT9098191.1 hypothetical protein [Methylovulum psychrotolerans]
MDFTTLLGKRAVGHAQAKDYCDWAEDLLLQSIESESIAILASLGVERSPDIYEVRAYFEKCVAELGWTIPEEKLAILAYAKSLCTQLCDGTLKPRIGLGHLQCFWDFVDDNPLYGIWYDLDEDICWLEQGEQYFWNACLAQENSDGFIIKVAKQFLELCELDLPDNFLKLSLCAECGHVGMARQTKREKPWLSVKLFRLIYGRWPRSHRVCSQCAESCLLALSDYEVRQRYLAGQC